jgi:hypothetical protein
MKKFLVAFIAVLLILPTLLYAPAEAASNLEKEQQSSKYEEQQPSKFTFEDVMALEPFISVENGLFKFDSNSAKKAGHDKELIKMQKDYLSDINKQINNGKLKAESNLEIVDLQPVVNGGVSIMATCPGKSTSLAHHWWGVDRYLNNCQANRFGADMASVAAGYTGAGIIAAIWFPAVGIAGGVIASYSALMSSRVYANNYGRGIYVAITYVAFFNIEPQ